MISIIIINTPLSLSLQQVEFIFDLYDTNSNGWLDKVCVCVCAFVNLHICLFVI